MKTFCLWIFAVSILSFSVFAETQPSVEHKNIFQFVDKAAVPSDTDFHLLIEEKAAQYEQTSEPHLKKNQAKALMLFHFMVDDGPDVNRYANELRTLANQLGDDSHVAIAELYLGFNRELTLDTVLPFIDKWQQGLSPALQRNDFIRIHTDIILTYAKIRPQIFPFEIEYLLQHLKRVGDHPGFKLETYVILGTLSATGWNIDQKVEHLEAFLKHAEKNKLPVQKYILLYNMAIELVNRKYSEASIYLAEKYVAMAKQQDLPEELFYGYERLGEALNRNGEYAKANDAFQAAEKYKKHAGERWIAQINMVTAENYFYMGELDKGKASLEKAEDYFKGAGENYRANYNYINRVLAKQALTEGDTQAALNFYEDYIDNNRDKVEQQRLENIEGVRTSMQRLIDQARENQLLAEKHLRYFQYISALLAIVILVIIWMAVRQSRTSAELRIKTVELRRLSRQDSLTKLFNRGFWEKQTKQQFENLRRYQHYQATMVLFDIDDFKTINDTYGHLIGDAVIKKVAQIIREEIREIDIAGRYGGEEFAILFPHTELKDAIKVTERIRKKIEESGIEFGTQKIDFTASFGLSQYKEELKSTKEWINEADIALYTSKQHGKNQCTAFD